MYVTDIVKDDKYAFSPSKMYYAPTHGDYQAYLDYIRELPLVPHPEVRSMVCELMYQEMIGSK